MVNQQSFSPAAVLPAPYRSEASAPARKFSARVAPEVAGPLRRTYYATEEQPLEIVLSLLTELDAELGRR